MRELYTCIWDSETRLTTLNVARLIPIFVIALGQTEARFSGANVYRVYMHIHT